MSYLKGLRPVTESTKLSLGTLVHAALKEHYRGGDWIDVIPVPHPDEPDPESELATIMLEGYFEWLEETGADVGHEIIVVEEEMEVPLGTFYTSWGERVDVVLHGTPDLLSRTPDGLLSLWDHKTVAGFGTLTDRRLQLNFQLLTYSWMWQQLHGERPQAVSLNMLRKVKRTASAKPPFYARETVQFNQAQLNAHESHMRQVVQLMLDAEADDYVGYPVPDSDCTWKCEFLTPCVMLDENPAGAQEMLNELYTRR